MNILMLTSTLPRFPGDMQANFVVEQAEAWLNARADDEIDILAPHDHSAPLFEDRDRLRITRFRYFKPDRYQRLAYAAVMPNIKRNPLLALQLPGFLIAQYRAALRLAKERKPKLIYAHWVAPQGIVAWWLRRQLGLPYILQNHSSDLAVFEKLGSVGRGLARLLLRDCSRFFCVNASQLDYARSLVPAGERAAFDAKALCLPMGISPTSTVSESAGEPEWDIATMARLTRKKGVQYLLEAAERLALDGLRPRIGIAGDGEDRRELEAMVHNADVTFTGFLTGREKEAFLASARRYAFPAKASGDDREGMPVALLEALGRGKPVLASRDTNIEMLPEWGQLQPHVTFVADPTDIEGLEAALRELLAADAEVASGSAKIVIRYCWDTLIDEYLKSLGEHLI